MTGDRSILIPLAPGRNRRICSPATLYFPVHLSFLAPVATMFSSCFHGQRRRRTRKKKANEELAPVLLVSGMGGSILNGRSKANGSEKRLWVRILRADPEFKKLWSLFDSETGGSSFLFSRGYVWRWTGEFIHEILVYRIFEVFGSGYRDCCSGRGPWAFCNRHSWSLLGKFSLSLTNNQPSKTRPNEQAFVANL